MKRIFSKFLQAHKNFWNPQTVKFLIEALILFAIALLSQHLADNYVNNLQAKSVGDLLLSHLPTVDIDFLIVQGALILSAAIIALLLAKPRYLPFTLKTLSVFVITRSISISLTHLGTDPNQLQFDTNAIGYNLYNLFFNAKNDFFFSGHTGLPILIALTFWREKFWRWLLLATSVVFGVSVLLAHIHYSIDVFAAPFMAYGIFALSRELFQKDYRLIHP